MIIRNVLALIVGINRLKITQRCSLQQGRVLIGQKYYFASDKKSDDKNVKTVLGENQVDEESTKSSTNELKKKDLTGLSSNSACSSSLDDTSSKEEPKTIKTSKASLNLNSLLTSMSSSTKELEEKNSTSSSSDSGSSSSSDDTSSDSDSEKAPKTIKAADKRAVASQKLNALLDTMLVTTSERLSGKLDLAKPIKTVQRQKEAKAKREKLKEVESLGLDLKIVDAVRDVAEDLGGDVKKTETELLQKLHDNVTQMEERKKTGAYLNSFLVGMKVEKTSKPSKRLKEYSSTSARMIPEEDDFPKIKSFPDIQKELKGSLKRRTPASRYKKVNLFGSGRLNIFSKLEASSEEVKGIPELETWDMLEEKEMDQLIRPPPSNAFEEMIMWTEQGKLWKFPIDNFQDTEEEEKYGFQDHVFLEPLLEDGFPKRGPIRHFMELVVTGLSKNPYLTVPEKHDHINWFRQYFKEKEKILDDLGVLD